MQKIDRLGWAAGFCVRTYGIRIGIRSNDPVCLKEVYRRLPPEWESTSKSVVDRLYSIIIGGKGPRANVRRFNLLYGDHLRLARSGDVEQVFDTLERDLGLFVAELARNRVFVHAGVVGWKGSAIVVPGRSFSGKSTLIAELVRAGATYYSDEYAVFDPKGRVHPFLRPLQLRNDGERKQTKIEISELGGRPGSGSLPVGLILVSEFKQGAKWRPQTLSPGAGALALLANTVSARRKPGDALDSLQKAVAKARILKGNRGEARDLAHFILGELSKK
jgi:hypothetical protein